MPLVSIRYPLDLRYSIGLVVVLLPLLQVRL